MKLFRFPDGSYSPHPTDREHAQQIGSRTYAVQGRCRRCDADRVHFVANDRCVNCARLEAIHAYNVLCAGLPVTPSWECEDLHRADSLMIGTGWPRMPASNSEATLWGAPAYLVPDCCPVQGHIGLLRQPDDKCYFCVEAAGVVDMRRATEGNRQIQADPDQIISREDARAAGLTLYRTGRACRKGHEGHRYVSTGHCVQCQRGG